MALKRTELCEATVGGFDLVVSRTGYTGERMAFELFVHPDQARTVEPPAGSWRAAGSETLRPGRARLAAHRGRLPLYGHEMGGELGPGRGRSRVWLVCKDL
jgi:glycine hydroxymethyltransferase